MAGIEYLELGFPLDGRLLVCAMMGNAFGDESATAVVFRPHNLTGKLSNMSASYSLVEASYHLQMRALCEHYRVVTVDGLGLVQSLDSFGYALPQLAANWPYFHSPCVLVVFGYESAAVRAGVRATLFEMRGSVVYEQEVVDSLTQAAIGVIVLVK